MKRDKKQFYNSLSPRAPQPLSTLKIIFLTFITLIAAFTMASISGCAVTQRPAIHIPKEAPKPVPIKNVEVALVLGAGGSRGIAHLGVIEVLEKAGVPIDLIVGSSAGSLMGALYSDNPNIQQIKKKVIKIRKTDLLDPLLSAILQMATCVTGPIQGNSLENFLVKEMKAKNFSELRIPLICVATNIEENHITLLRSGPIAPAVHASAALPPFFSPVRLYKQTLIDGGVLAPVPVQVARLFKPKVVIAVDISTPASRARLNNTFELLHRALHISYYELSRMQSTRADITIHPDLVGYGTFDDQYNERLYEKGKQAALESLDSIKEELAKKGIQLRPCGTVH